MLYFIHSEWKKHRVWYKIPWSRRETCFQCMESLERSWVSDIKNLSSEGIFSYKSFSGLLTASSQPQQLLSRSSLLRGHSCKCSCTPFTVQMIWAQPCTSAPQIQRCGIVISVLPPAWMYQRKPQKYGAEFLGTHLAFGLGQGSELCASIGCRRKRVAQSFVGQVGLCECGDRVWSVHEFPLVHRVTQLLRSCPAFTGWSLLRTDSSDGADSHSPGTNSAPINAQRLWQV